MTVSNSEYDRSETMHNYSWRGGRPSSACGPSEPPLTRRNGQGAFRAGRRAHSRPQRSAGDGGTVTVAGSHDGYRHLHGGPVHQQVWTLTPGRLEIADDASGGGRHTAAGQLHVEEGPDAPVTFQGHGAPVTTGAREVALEFGRLRPATRHQVAVGRAELPMRLGWTMTW